MPEASTFFVGVAPVAVVDSEPALTAQADGLKSPGNRRRVRVFKDGGVSWK